MTLGKKQSQYLGFCLDCGALLPPIGSEGGITCYDCSKKFQDQDINSETVSEEVSYSVVFNPRTPRNVDKPVQQMDLDIDTDDEEEEGPIVERKCSKCGNNKMSYTTLQLRSADEGQTVFFTCTKCKHKETENS